MKLPISSSSRTVGEGELPSSCDQQEHRSLAFFGQFRLSCDLVVGRSPFLNMRDSKAEPDEQIKGGSDRAVLLDHVLGKPIRRARALHAIAIDRPYLAA